MSRPYVKGVQIYVRKHGLDRGDRMSPSYIVHILPGIIPRINLVIIYRILPGIIQRIIQILSPGILQEYYLEYY